MAMRLTFTAFAVLLTTADVQGADHLDVAVAPAMKEYCHIIQFPEGWKVPTGPGPIYRYEYYDKYEFRALGPLSSNFLVRGVIDLGKVYTKNIYTVDLSDANAPAVSTTEQAWESATRVSTRQRSAISQLYIPKPNQALEYRGVRFNKSGEFWSYEGGSVSPDQSWLVLQSWTGSASSGSGTGFGKCFPFGCRGKIFLDIFNLDTSKKIFTIEGTYSGGDPDGNLLRSTEWLTERYFIVPMGDHRERCLVCEFGGRRPGQMKQ